MPRIDIQHPCNAGKTQNQAPLSMDRNKDGLRTFRPCEPRGKQIQLQVNKQLLNKQLLLYFFIYRK